MRFVVTGGSSGIGEALAKRLADLDHRVLILGRRKKELQRVSLYAPKLIEFVAGDLTQEETLLKIGLAIKGDKIDGLVQNAGKIEPIIPMSEISIEAYEQLQKINVTAPIALFQQLKSQLSGARVLHLSSLAAHVPFASWGAYCMSKSALYMLYQILKKECLEIHFGSVMPGITDTSMQSLIRNSESMLEKDHDFFIDLHKKQGLLKPSVVAQFLSWLLLEVSAEQFAKKEWDIYETIYHKEWLKEGEVRPL